MTQLRQQCRKRRLLNTSIPERVHSSPFVSSGCFPLEIKRAKPDLPLLWWQPSIMLERSTFGSKLVSVRRLLLTSPWHIIQLLGEKKNCLGSPSSRLRGKFSKILMALMALFPRFYSVVITTFHLSGSPCIPGGRRSGRELYYIGISTRLVTNDRHKAPSSEFFIQFSIFHH